MSAIMNALNSLDAAVAKVETAASRKSKSAKGRAAQPDLFAAPRAAGTVSTGLGFDRNMLAKKLDMTIARVEQLLGEA